MTVTADARMALDPAALFAAAFRLEPLPWQADYLRAQGDVVVVKGRQVGASTASAALAIHVTRYRDGSNVVIVSPTLKQSGEVLGKARAGCRTLGIRLVQDSASVIQLANGSRIVSLPGTPRSVRGWSARLLIIDEAAFVVPETFTAAAALVATGGRTIYQSTPGHQDGDFYDAVGAEDERTRFTIPSDSVPTITAEFLEAQRRAMSPDEYAQEFECSFGRSASRLFTMDMINSLFPDSAA